MPLPIESPTHDVGRAVCLDQIWGLLLSLPTAPSLVRALHDCASFDWAGKLAPCSSETVAADPAAPWQRLYTLQAVAGQLRESLHGGAASGARRSAPADRWDKRFIGSGALVHVVAHLDSLLQEGSAPAPGGGDEEDSKPGDAVAGPGRVMTGMDHRQLFLPTIAAVTRIVVFCVPNVRTLGCKDGLLTSMCRL